MKQPKNLHRRQLLSLFGSDYFLVVTVAIGVIAVLIHAIGV